MTNISIIGVGNMGSAITGIAVKSGAAVQVIGREQSKVDALAESTGATAALFGAPITGDIVVLAVPYGSVEEIVDAYGDQLADKVIVDITNPVDFSTFDGLVVPADGSAADVIATKVPSAKVVKAFNTTFAATLATGEVGPNGTTVLVAGDNQDAKAAVMGFITAGGLNAEDAGSLKRARELESMGFLQISLAAREIIGWTAGFAVAK